MTEQADPLDGIEATARWTAAARAQEREQPEPLVDDPWAERLAGEAGMAWLARQAPGATLPIVIRMRFFDDWLGAALGGAGLLQVVLLGAGLEPRAWRLPCGGGSVAGHDGRPGSGAARDGLAGGRGAAGRRRERPRAMDAAAGPCGRPGPAALLVRDGGAGEAGGGGGLARIAARQRFAPRRRTGPRRGP